MTRRGYFENQGGKFRLRIVKPGYDADDPGVKEDNVIIDSDCLGVLSILDSGIYVAENSSDITNKWIVSGWGLEYPPLCNFLFNYNRVGPTQLWRPFLIVAGSSSRLTVTNGGIFINIPGFNSSDYPLKIKWVAYRIPVKP